MKQISKILFLLYFLLFAKYNAAVWLADGLKLHVVGIRSICRSSIAVKKLYQPNYPCIKTPNLMYKVEWKTVTLLGQNTTCSNNIDKIITTNYFPQFQSK